MKSSAYPDTLSALTAASDQYEEALAGNNIPLLDALFSASPSTIRLGATENLFGPDEIAAFRRARKGGAPRRTRLRREIVALGPDAGCVTIIFRTEPDGRTGRQTQSWIREGESWRILVAHVSFLS